MWIDDGHLVPDPRHPDHPVQQQQRRRHKLRIRLDSDPDLQRFISERAPEAALACDAFRSLAPFAPHDPKIVLHADGFLSDLFGAIRVASERLGPRDVLSLAKQHYLIERIIPAEYVDQALLVTEPVMVFIAAPGLIHMAFTGASQNERRAYDPLIDRAQKHFQHPKDAGGRTSVSEDPELSRLAQAAAKLHHWQGRGFAWIDRFLDLPRRATQPQPETPAQRGRRYVAIGEPLLRQRYGVRWKEPPEAEE